MVGPRRLKTRGELQRDIRNGGKDQVLRIQRELAWRVRQRVQQVLNALELERQLDEQLAKTRTWSKEWWRLLRQIDRVRTQLVEWKGIQVAQRMRSP